MPTHLTNLPELLRELNDALAIEDAPQVEWIVCGGTALALQNLTARTTRDIDVLAQWDATMLEVVVIGTFSPAVRRAIDRVAAAHEELGATLPAWVNLGPQQIVSRGLPEGFASRLVRICIGDRLTLHLLGRLDLIALKLYAASDDLGSRQAIHLADLIDLKPSAHDLEFAIAWVDRMPDPQHRLRPALKRIVEDLGHDDLAYYL